MKMADTLRHEDKNKYGDKYLCYCSKVTHRKFHNELSSYNFSNLESLCDNLKLAKHCAACLPNIEDEFFKLKGKKVELNNINKKSEVFSLKDRIKMMIDKLSGDMLVTQYGHLPMLVSSSIKTWLVISNETPSLINSKGISYKINLIIFNSKGKRIKKINQLVQPNSNLKVCLNQYVPKPNNALENYYVKLIRTPTKRGFRGSTRPHFFYQTKNSMATVHTQDGASRLNQLNLSLSKNQDKNFIFLINPNNEIVKMKPKLKIMNNCSNRKEFNYGELMLQPYGSNLLELSNTNYEIDNYLFYCKSNIPIKCYYIIADSKLENLSVDHI